MSRETPAVKRVAPRKVYDSSALATRPEKSGMPASEGVELPVADLRLARDERVLAELDAGQDAEAVVVALGRLGVALAHAVGQQRERGQRREAVPELGAVVLGAAVERCRIVDARDVVVVVPVRRLAAAHVEIDLAADGGRRRRRWRRSRCGARAR